MFAGIWAWVASVAKWLLKRCTKQWYLVEVKTNESNDWDVSYPTHCCSLRSAKRYLVDVTDTYFWIKCRILDPDGNVVDETVANDFYGATLDIMYMYVENNMTCAETMAVWRQQEMQKMARQECSDVEQ